MANDKVKNFGIVVDDGTVKEVIRNKYGQEVGVFYFVPTDLNMSDRYDEVVKKIPEITKPLGNIDINPDGSTNEESAKETMAEAVRKLYEACDYLFGGNYSEAFFGKVHPFAPCNGKFYCENALEAVGNYIGSRFDHEFAKIDDRVAKYTHGYRNGKHKNGGQRKKKK